MDAEEIKKKLAEFAATLKPVEKEVTMAQSKLKWAEDTGNFDNAAQEVFQRLIHGRGHGLLILWGGGQWGPKANKGLFLEMVKAFEKGADSEEHYLSTKFPVLWNLLSQLDPGKYQCIRVKEILEAVTTPKDEIYKIPLAVAVLYATGLAGYNKGWKAWRDLVILCDDIEKFMRFNKRANEEFLNDLAPKLDNQTAITFLGASQTIWTPALLGDHLVHLGGGD